MNAYCIAPASPSLGKGAGVVGDVDHVGASARRLISPRASHFGTRGQQSVRVDSQVEPRAHHFLIIPAARMRCATQRRARASLSAHMRVVLVVAGSLLPSNNAAGIMSR